VNVISQILSRYEYSDGSTQPLIARYMLSLSKYTYWIYSSAIIGKLILSKLYADIIKQN